MTRAVMHWDIEDPAQVTVADLLTHATAEFAHWLTQGELRLAEPVQWSLRREENTLRWYAEADVEADVDEVVVERLMRLGVRWRDTPGCRRVERVEALRRLASDPRRRAVPFGGQPEDYGLESLAKVRARLGLVHHELGGGDLRLVAA